MKLLIVGSRTITDFDIGKYVSENVDAIVSGGALGVDSLAEKYADSHRISKIIIRPSYKLYGKAAAIRRNEELVKISDKVVAIWDGKSKGTQYTVNYAKKLGKEVEVVIVKEE